MSRAFSLLIFCACIGEVGTVPDAGAIIPPPGGEPADSGTTLEPLTVTITSAPQSPTRETMPSFTFTGTGAVGFECSMDELVGGAISPCTSPISYALTDGNHAFRVRAVDAMGVRTEPALSRFDVDTVGPTVTLSGAAPPFTFTASEEGPTFECRVVPAAFASCRSPSSPGQGTFEVRATDAAGNVGPVARVTWSTAALALAGTTFAIPTTPGQVRHASVAHDSTHDLYGVVYGNSRIGATCITADGVAAGSPVDLSQTTSWTQSPWVAYSPQADVFFAAWLDTRLDPNRPFVFGRLFRCSTAGVALPAGDFQINADANNADARNQLGVAYSPASQTFFVAWPQGMPSRKLAVLGQRVSTSGALTGGPITVMPERDWYEAVKLAHNPAADEFVAIASTVIGMAGVSVQRVRASDGALQGGTVEVVSGLAGTWTPQVVYVPATNELFTTWFQGTLMAARVSPVTGMAIAAPFQFAPGSGAAEGLHLGFSAVTGSFVAVFHGQTAEDWGQALTASAPRGAAMEVTQSPAGTSGNFDPRIVAHPTRREWLVVTSRNFNTLVGQRLGE